MYCMSTERDMDLGYRREGERVGHEFRILFLPLNQFGFWTNYHHLVCIYLYFLAFSLPPFLTYPDTCDDVC